MNVSAVSEARDKLARYARRLNARSGAAGLPPLILMTDDRLEVDWAIVAATLPAGCAIIARHREDHKRAWLASVLKAACRKCRLLLLVAEDMKLASRIRADGVHIPQARSHHIAGLRRQHPGWLVTTSAHDMAAVVRAGQAGADAALVSPAFATRSHVDRGALGSVRLAQLATEARVPVYALGGINATNAIRLSAIPLAGFASISGWIS